MLLEELEEKVRELRAKPLMVFCKQPDGGFAVTPLCECVKSGSSYISIVEDDLDDLLAKYLEERRKGHEFYEEEAQRDYSCN